MSRLIIKNLPSNISEDVLRSKFEEKGQVTDVQLKYKNGVFRRFGFVGYKNEEDAQSALSYFNNTCIGSFRITVEVCKDLGSAEKPRPWSKYAKGSAAYSKMHPEEGSTKSNDDVKEPKKKTKKGVVQDPKVKELLEKYKDDELFAEFMETHLGKNKLWSNDVLGGTGDGPAVTEETMKELQNKIVESIPDESLASAKISDFEYLRRKMVKSKQNDIKEEQNLKDDDKPVKSDSSSKPVQKKKFFTVILRGLPVQAKKNEVKHFLKPLRPASIRVPRNIKSLAYVGFKTEKEYQQVFVKNKSFMQGHRIFVSAYEEKNSSSGHNTPNQDKDDKFKQQEESLKNEETIAESGRIFVRNLPYLVTEEDIQTLFSSYGELSEVLLPIDQRTRKVKGFATVTFLIPEHAVRAYSELDGKVFQGRMLHLLPAKTKPSIDELLEEEGLDYKKKKALLQKKLAASAHNWNTLFLGQNAVTDLIAETYNTTKEKVLDDSGKGSVAVRLALGETQIVAETKKFLIENGVQLDVFNQPAAHRSKTIILAKNLPAKTSSLEIRTLFEPFGIVGRVVLPPTGVTALVEFMDKIEAKKAFLKLAYTKFKNLPLYLEWAPEGVLSGSNDNEGAGERLMESQAENSNNQKVDPETEPEPDTTLYLKNLNFQTTERSLKEHFEKYGAISSVMIATKPNPKSPGERLSQGFGFVQFYLRSSAEKALKNLQNSDLDGHKIEIKRSHRTLKLEVAPRKTVNQAKPTGTKILVRNIPFQATQKEVFELFKVFGEIKTLRLPKKMVGTGSHRGFAFVDFHSKNDAKNAMDSLCQSTHLYGRRLVLEWAAADEDDVDVIRKRTAERFTSEEPHSKTFRKGLFDMKSSSKEKAEDSD